MSRLRTGHTPDDWRDLGPSEPLPVKGWFFGSHVTGPSAPAKGAGLTWNQRTAEDQAREERERAMAYQRTKRWRERRRKAS